MTRTLCAQNHLVHSFSRQMITVLHSSGVEAWRWVLAKARCFSSKPCFVICSRMKLLSKRRINLATRGIVELEGDPSMSLFDPVIHIPTNPSTLVSNKVETRLCGFIYTIHDYDQQFNQFVHRFLDLHVDFMVSFQYNNWFHLIILVQYPNSLLVIQ